MWRQKFWLATALYFMARYLPFFELVYMIVGNDTDSEVHLRLWIVHVGPDLVIV
jgi:hypothetical protein